MSPLRWDEPPDRPAPEWVVWLCRAVQVWCSGIILGALFVSEGDPLVGLAAFAGAVFCASGYLPDDIREGRAE